MWVRIQHVNKTGKHIDEVNKMDAPTGTASIINNNEEWKKVGRGKKEGTPDGGGVGGRRDLLLRNPSPPPKTTPILLMQFSSRSTSRSRSTLDQEVPLDWSCLE